MFAGAGCKAAAKQCQKYQVLLCEKAEEQRQDLHSGPPLHDGPLYLTMTDEGASQGSEKTRGGPTSWTTASKENCPDEYGCFHPV